MSEKKYAEDDPERTLVTLDQLSQTIEVMTSVVNRLRRHLSDQIKAQLQSQLEAQEELEALANEQIESPIQAATSKSNVEAITIEAQQGNDENNEQERHRESFVVEISQQEAEPVRKSSKTLH